MLLKQTALIILILAAAVFPGNREQNRPANGEEARAVAFLLREVPAWSQNNGCYSCHNNGDAARALFTARQKGFAIPQSAIAGTLAWLRQPARWNENKGEPGFSDRRLADIQFSAALLSAFETGLLNEPKALEQAAQRLAEGQEADGSWKIDAGNALGSPATYGSALGTWMAVRAMRQAGLAAHTTQLRRAASSLAGLRTDNLPIAATLLLASSGNASPLFRKKREEALALIRRGQTRDGGWGPYADSPPEAFDTAIVLLSLMQSGATRDAALKDRIQRGRAFLAAAQLSDGSWPATTRPAGNESYAQMMSTTAWATIALLETHDL